MTTDETNNVIARVRKLLAVARDKAASEHEAATAAALAQRLMSRHAIDAALLEDRPAGETDEACEAFARVQLYRGTGACPTWLLLLGGAVCRASDLRHAYSSSRWGHDITAYGPPSACELARVLLEWLASEVERLELEEKRMRRERVIGSAPGRSFWNGFRNGCATRIGQRLHEARAEEREAARRGATGPSAEDYAEAARAADADRLLELDAKRAAGGSGYALARVESALVRLEQRPARIDAWLKEEGVKFGKGRGRTTGNNAGYSAGKAAGGRAVVKPGAGRLA